MNQDHIERELQFDAPDLRAIETWIESQPAHAAIAIQPKDAKKQHDVYFDTDDWSIYNAGYSLRVRRLVEGAEATLKALKDRSDGAQERREINQALSGENDEWSGHPGPVSDRVRLMAGGRSLQALFTIETLRTNFTLRKEDEALAQLSLDDATVGKGQQTLRRLLRMEVEEEREGGLLSLMVLVQAIERACKLQPAKNSKFEAGLEAAGLAPDAPPDFGYAELEADATAGEFAYALLRRYLGDFLRHEPGTRLGEDPEQLHDMRVATRRLRAAMSTFKDVLPVRFQTFREELKWIGGDLGQVRDLDVQLAWLLEVRGESDWEEGTALGPLLDELTDRRAAARTALLDALGSERYATLLKDLIAALRQGEEPGGDAALPIRAYGTRVLRKHYKRFRREAEGVTKESEPALYHATRIQGKRLRYSTEALESVFGRPGARMVAAMRSVQDLLGEFQDCNVTISWLREIAASRGAGWPPVTVLRMGELLEQRRSRAEALRLDWPKERALVRKRWKQLRKSIRQGGKKRSDAPGLEIVPLPRPPVQRSFWLLQRFFRRGGDRQTS